MAVCRLCFKSCESNCEAGEETTAMLNILLLQIDLPLSEKLIICKSCTESLKNFSEFKSACLCTENYINSSITDSNELDLKQVYLNKCDNKYGDIPDGHIVCRLCMELVNLGCFISLNDEAKDVVSARIILGTYFPELDLNITNDATVCTTCYAMLQSYSTFLKNCLVVKEEISHYSESEGIDMKHTVKLNDAIQFASTTDMCFYESEEHIKPGIKCEHFEGTEMQESDVKYEELDIKTDDTDFTRLQNDGTFPLQSDTSTKSSGITIYTCEECPYSTEVESNFNLHMLIHNPQHELIEDASGVTMYQCTTCEYKTKLQSNMKRHSLTHKSSFQDKLYRCLLCTYISKYKRALKEHMLIHKNMSEVTMHQCELCKYKTKYKNAFNRHMITHKDESEVIMYQCEKCTYKTKFKNVINRHVVSHNFTPKLKRPFKQRKPQVQKNVEVKVHQCALCEFKTIHRSSYRRHKLTHKEVSEVTLYQCKICDFKTKHRNNLKAHMLVHKDSSEVAMYQCKICDFTTKRKNTLNKHMVLHKDASEQTMYSCELCTFQTIYKRYLTKHVALHEVKSSQSDLRVNEAKLEYNLEHYSATHNEELSQTIYHCNMYHSNAKQICTFETEDKTCLEQHFLTHKGDVTLHQCEICDYKTKRRSDLKKHLLVHKDASEVPMHQCEICEFKTKYKNNLNQHILHHKAASEITSYQCDLCKYETKHKGNLTKHMVVHFSEVTTYNCDKCNYTTKRKNNLRQHSLTHVCGKSVTSSSGGNSDTK